MARRWDTHELPVLRAIESGEPIERAHSSRSWPGSSTRTRCENRCGALTRADTCSETPDASLADVVYRLTEKARVRLGQCPGDALAEAFLELLRARADTAPTEGERRRLDRAVESLAAISGQTLSNILAQLAMRGL